MNFFGSIKLYGIRKALRRLIIVEIVESKTSLGSSRIFCALVLDVAKESVTIQGRIETEGPAELLSWIGTVGPHVPVILVISSDRVLHRLIPAAEWRDRDRQIKNILHGASVEDFSFQDYPLNDNQHFVSLIRRRNLDSCLQVFDEIQKRIVHVALGPYPVLQVYNVFGFFSVAQANISVLNYNIRVQDGLLTEVSISPYNQGQYTGEIDFDGEIIEEKVVMAYSFGLCFIMQPFFAPGLTVEAIQENSDEYVFGKHSKQFIVVFLMFIFFMLLGSSGMYAFYKHKYEQVQNKYAQSQESYSRLLAEDLQAVKKKEMLTRYSLDRPSSVSFYADQLTTLLPSEMYLRKLIIHPVDPASARLNPLFINDRIILEGNCYSGGELYQWVSFLRRLPWIKEVIITKYEARPSEQLSSFTMEVIKAVRQ